MGFRGYTQRYSGTSHSMAWKQAATLRQMGFLVKIDSSFQRRIFGNPPTIYRVLVKKR